MRAIFGQKSLSQLCRIRTPPTFIPRLQQCATFSVQRKFVNGKDYENYLQHKAYLYPYTMNEDDLFDLMQKAQSKLYKEGVMDEVEAKPLLAYSLYFIYNSCCFHHHFYLMYKYGLTWNESFDFLVATSTYVTEHLLRFDWKSFLEHAKLIVPTLASEEWNFILYTVNIQYRKKRLLTENEEIENTAAALKEQEEEWQKSIDYFQEIACDSCVERLREYLSKEGKENKELFTLKEFEMKVKSFRPRQVRHRVIGEVGQKSMIMGAQEEERRYAPGSVVATVGVDAVVDRYLKDQHSCEVKYSILYEACISHHTPTEWIVKFITVASAKE